MSTPRDHALILIADDNPVNLDVLAGALAAEGFDTVVAADGEMVLEQVRYEIPDLILLDAVMPVLDGFEACKRLKEDPATRDVPIIFTTALTDPAHKIRGLRLGAVDYVVKPFEHEEVLLRVKTHLQLRNMARALGAKNVELERQIEARTAMEAGRAALTRELEVRTEELRHAKEDLERELVERRHADEVRAALAAEIIAVQARRLEELSTPLIPITDSVVVMPLVGALDNARAEQVLETALRGASERGAEFLIFDITGVRNVDEDVAATLLRAAGALRLLGTRVVITGIRFDVARMLAAQNIDVGDVVTRGTLQSGIAHALGARSGALGFSRGNARRARGAP
jgi:DNA-binding response OmpR family regulator/anti-anti-sigma regulatory factor